MKTATATLMPAITTATTTLAPVVKTATATLMPAIKTATTTVAPVIKIGSATLARVIVPVLGTGTGSLAPVLGPSSGSPARAGVVWSPGSVGALQTVTGDGAVPALPAISVGGGPVALRPSVRWRMIVTAIQRSASMPRNALTMRSLEPFGTAQLLEPAALWSARREPLGARYGDAPAGSFTPLPPPTAPQTASGAGSAAGASGLSTTFFGAFTAPLVFLPPPLSWRLLAVRGAPVRAPFVLLLDHPG